MHDGYGCLQFSRRNTPRGGNLRARKVPTVNVQRSKDGSRLIRNASLNHGIFWKFLPSDVARYVALGAVGERQNEGQARTSFTRKYRRGSRFSRIFAQRKSDYRGHEYASHGFRMIFHERNTPFG